MVGGSLVMKQYTKSYVIMKTTERGKWFLTEEFGWTQNIFHAWLFKNKGKAPTITHKYGAKEVVQPIIITAGIYLSDSIKF